MLPDAASGLSSSHPPVPASCDCANADAARDRCAAGDARLAGMDVRMGNGFARDVASNGVHHGLEPPVRAIALPAFQRQRLDLAEAERRLDPVEADRDISIAPLRAPRLVAHEMAVMADRALAPRDDHAFGGLEMLLDILVPIGAAADMGVPPDAEAFGLERLDKRK